MPRQRERVGPLLHRKSVLAVPRPRRAAPAGTIVGAAVQTEGAVTADPQHVSITEPVRGSEIPVQLKYVEMTDGLYAPIGLRTPPGQGPFPLILFASGNGGGGTAGGRGFRSGAYTTEVQTRFGT